MRSCCWVVVEGCCWGLLLRIVVEDCSLELLRGVGWEKWISAANLCCHSEPISHTWSLLRSLDHPFIPLSFPTSLHPSIPHFNLSFICPSIIQSNPSSIFSSIQSFINKSIKPSAHPFDISFIYLFVFPACLPSTHSFIHIFVHPFIACICSFTWLVAHMTTTTTTSLRHNFKVEQIFK